MRRWTLWTIQRIDRLRLLERYPAMARSLLGKMAALHGPREAENYSRKFLAETIMSTFFTAIAAFLLYAAGGGDPTFGVFLLFVPAVPLVLFRRLSEKLRKKQRAVLTELPVLINKLILYLEAGDPLLKALTRCSAVNEHHIMYREMARLREQLANNTPLFTVLEEFNRSFRIHEVHVWVNTILLNYRKGGDSLILSLQFLNEQMWQNRKALARTLGEEASAKMVFPMSVIFLVVMVVVAAPVFLSFK